LLQQHEIALDISAGRFSGGGGFQFLVQACFHETSGKFVTGRKVQNIGSRNPDGHNFTTHAHLQGGFSKGIEDRLGRSV
jgi:hypothetical protein